MSVQGLAWAFRQQIDRSSEKFVLVAMCNYLREDGRVSVSVSRLERDTALDRKTIISAIKSLCARGLLADSGRRSGLTNSIPVYDLLTEDSNPNSGAGPKAGSDAENGTGGTRLVIAALPSDWREWVMLQFPSLDPDQMWDQFADYWRHKPGPDGLKKNWKTTFRNWCKNRAISQAKGSAQRISQSKNARFMAALQAPAQGNGFRSFAEIMGGDDVAIQ